MGIYQFSNLKFGRSLKIDFYISKEIFSHSFAAILITLGAVLVNQGTMALAGIFLDLKSVGLFALSLMIYISITPFFFQVFATILSPIASRVKSKKQ